MTDAYQFFRPKREPKTEPPEFQARELEEIEAAKRIGAEVARLRKAAGLTQEKLALVTRLSTVCIQYIETGKQFPTGRTLYRIAKALGADLVIPCEVEE